MREPIVMRYASMWPREVCDIRVRPEKYTRGKSRRKKSEAGGRERLFIRVFPELRKPGVYILYRDEHPYYIGKAEQRLGRRIFDHANKLTDRYYNFWNFFSAFVVSEKKYIKEVEKILIAAMPTANSAMPRMKRLKPPPDIARQIRQIRKHRANPLTHRDMQKILRAHI